MQVERDQLKTLLIVTGIVGAFIGAMWYPMHNKQAALKAEINAFDDEIQTGRTVTIGLPALGQQIVLLEAEIDGSDKYVPQDPDLASLLRQWTTLLKDSEVSDEEIQTQAVVRGDEFSLIPIKLKFRGSFASVFGFLQYVEQMNRLSRFTKLEVKGNAGRPDEPLVVRIELSTFFGPGEGGE